MSNKYREYMTRLPTVPWFQGFFGSRWLYMIGLTFDALSEATKLATKARFVETAPDDAIPLLGRDNAIEPGLDESLDAYRERVGDAWEVWPQAGTEAGLLGQLRAWLPNTEIALISNREWSVSPVGRPATGDKVAISGDDWWSRMWVIIGPQTRWDHDGTWAEPGTWDDGGTWDSTAFSFEIEAAKRIVTTWKAGHEYVPTIIVLTPDAELWDYPQGTWGEPGFWNDGIGVIRWEIT